MNRLEAHLRMYDENPNQATEIRILDTLKVVKSFDTSLRLNVDDVSLTHGYELKRKLVTLFDQCISVFMHKKDFHRDIQSTRNCLEKTITIEEMRLLSNQNLVSQPLNKKDFKNFTWFKIGLLFAQGIPQKLYKKYKNDKGHYTKIATELGFKVTDKTFFSDTINNTVKRNNNIYSNRSKMMKIQEHCEIMNIEIVNDFIDSIPPE